MNLASNPTLFAIYSRQDAPRVYPLVKALEEHGVDVFIDAIDIAHGQEWSTRTRDAMDKATAALVFVSRAMGESAWATHELEAFHNQQKPIFPVTLEAKPDLPASLHLILARLHTIDLTDPTPQDLLNAARLIANTLANAGRLRTRITVQNADILQTPCDVLIMKYAQGFCGADRAVATALGLSERQDGALSVGRFLRIPTKGKLPSRRVLFVGVPELWDFGYAEIRRFARDALAILAKEDCEKASLAMTMHGANYGLDEREAFSAQVAGLMEYFDSPDATWHPESVVIVERDRNRAERLTAFLASILPAASPTRKGQPTRTAPRSIPDAGVRSDAKQHVFVAMPYDDTMQDVYTLGISASVNAAGCLCERCDRSVYTGDVLDRIRKRIGDAALVLADVTGANPNVYLEVGYAWGRKVPTLLIAREGEQLEFDLRTHRCIFYKNICHLKDQLTALLPDLMDESPRDSLP